jgi:hypothetical protein
VIKTTLNPGAKGRFDHGAAKLKGLKSQLRMLRRKRKKFQNFEVRWARI